MSAHISEQGQARYSYTVKAGAQLLGVSPDFIRDRISDGTLPAFSWGAGKRKVLRVGHDDLNNLLKPVPTIGYNPNARILGGVA